MTESPSKRSWWAWVLPGMILLPTMFWGILPRGSDYLLVAALLYFCLLGWIISRSKPKGVGNVTFRLLWIGFIASATLSHYLNAAPFRASVFVLAMTGLIFCISAGTQRWVYPAVALLGVFGSVNAVATVWMYFNEGIFARIIKPRFFAEIPGAVGFTSGLTAHYTYNATYIVCSLIVVLCFLQFGQLSRTIRVLLALLFVINMFGLVLTSKRAHLLVVLVAMFTIYLLPKARGRAVKMIITGGAIALALSYAATLIPGIGDSLDRLFSTSAAVDLNEVTTGRVVLWEQAIAGGVSAPLTGQGWGTYLYSWGSNAGNTTHAHNQFLEVFYSLGYPGLIVYGVLFVWSFALVMRVSLRVCRSGATAPTQRIAASAALGLQVFFILYSSTTGILLSEAFTFVPYLLSIAIALTLAPTARAVKGGSALLSNTSVREPPKAGPRVRLNIQDVPVDIHMQPS